MWCRERWTPRRDLMKPSRGLLKPARCAVALVQLAGPTGAEAADIKRALRGSLGLARALGALGALGAGTRCDLPWWPARAISSPSMAVAIRRDAHTRSTHHHLPTRAGRTVCALPNTSLPANTRQGKPGGRAAALRRDAAAARGVSGKQRAGDGHRAPEWGGPGAGCRCGRGRVQVWSGRDRSGESG